jgi:chromate transporter
MPVETPAAETPPAPTFREALRFWLKLGFISFGGPAGQIAIMHRELVERRRWISEARFLHALNYCMLLPGPEAQQLATYSGWLLHGIRGGLAAGILFVLPSAILLWGLSWAYVTCGSLPWVAGIFYGLKPAVLAIVTAALFRIGKRVLKNWVMVALAVMAWVALASGRVPFPWLIAAAGLVGWLGSRWAPGKFPASAEDSHSLVDPATRPRPTWTRAVKMAAICGSLWWAPTVVAGMLSQWTGAIFHQGAFFGKAALVTFGGAYAVLPYVAREAVEHYGWLSQPQVMDGLGLAETTPGPLIMVLQFVGFVGAWQHPGGLSPLVAATLGAAISTWATFAPCFLWVFVGAPYIEQLRSHRSLNSALSAVTAAVVGVIANLALWFGWHVLRTATGGIDGFGAAVASLAFVGLARWGWNVLPVIAGSALAGLGWKLLVG